MKKTTLLALPLALAMMSATAWADSLVRVTLIDKTGAADGGNLRLGMGMNADMSKAKMAVNANPNHVKRGAVRFDVTNLASAIVHEVIVAQITSEDQMLPYDESRAKVDAEQLFTRHPRILAAPSTARTRYSALGSAGRVGLTAPR